MSDPTSKQRRFRAHVGVLIGKAQEDLRRRGFTETPWGWELHWIPPTSTATEDLAWAVVDGTNARGEHDAVKVTFPDFFEDFD